MVYLNDVTWHVYLIKRIRVDWIDRLVICISGVSVLAMAGEKMRIIQKMKEKEKWRLAWDTITEI